jgi:AcrR family transcriptional regulator
MAFEINCDAKEGPTLKEKHVKIAEAAAALFVEKGFHNTSIREIAKACGMSMGNLYHYIKSKDDVLFLVYQEVYWNWEENLKAVEKEEIQDPGEKLKALVQAMLKSVYENKDHIQMTFRESKFLEKSALKNVLAIESQFIEVFVKLIQEGVQKGVFRRVDPQITGNLIAYNMFFYPLRGWYFRGEVELESIEEQIVDFIMNGLIK